MSKKSSKKKILIIDDEVFFAKLAKKNLELIGNFNVDIAANGTEGLAAAKKIKPDLILLDIMMPGIDGFEVLKRLKEDEATVMIPVVMLSAKEDSDTKAKASQLFGQMFLTKPIESAELKAKIDSVFKKKAA